jgi:hypothetical protein
MQKVTRVAAGRKRLERYGGRGGCYLPMFAGKGGGCVEYEARIYQEKLA